MDELLETLNDFGEVELEGRGVVEYADKVLPYDARVADVLLDKVSDGLALPDVLDSLGINKKTLRAWERDEQFALALSRAERERLRWLKEESYDKDMVGMYSGDTCPKESKVRVESLSIWMRAMFPESYRQGGDLTLAQQNVTITVKAPEGHKSTLDKFVPVKNMKGGYDVG